MQFMKTKVNNTNLNPPTHMSITNDLCYFTNYCSAGSYDENYLAYSGVEYCIDIINRFNIHIGSVVVLGAATG